METTIITAMEPGTFLWWIGRDPWSWAWTGSLVTGIGLLICGRKALNKANTPKKNDSTKQLNWKGKWLLATGVAWLAIACVVLPLTGYVKGGPWLNGTDKVLLHNGQKKGTYLIQRQEFFGGQAGEITKAIGYLHNQTHKVRQSIADVQFMLKQEEADPDTDEDIESMNQLLSKTVNGIEDLKQNRSLAWQLYYKLQHQPSADLRQELEQALQRGSNSAAALIDMYKFMGTEQDQHPLIANEAGHK
jgi:hypothetical protein